jgi:hypothetical protein
LQVGLALGRHEGVNRVKVRVLAVPVMHVQEPSAPVAVLAPVRALAREPLERHFPEMEVRPADVARAAMRTLHHRQRSRQVAAALISVRGY